MQIGIIGAGHVGLPTGVVLAHMGHQVVALDDDEATVELLNDGVMPFYEPELEDLAHAATRSGRLRFVTDPRELTNSASLVFICVGTPQRVTGEANLIAVERAVETLAKNASSNLVVVEKSTVPTGTARRVEEILRRHNQTVEFKVVCNPEFLREGKAVEDSLNPARILVGSDSREALATMKELYQPLIHQGAQWIETDLQTAELAKHASNAFLALKVSFANALARISELAGADVTKVTAIMEADPRIGAGHLHAGLGFGGSCFPKDLAAFERLSSRLGYGFPILPEIARINEETIEAAFRKVEEALWNLESKTICLWGLSFKPNTDDIRFSPALALARLLLQSGAHVKAYDPRAGEPARAELPDLQLATDPYEAARDSNCAVLCTEWDDLLNLDMKRVHDLMDLPMVLDGRNALDGASLVELGFTYLSMGRAPLRPDGS